jgi:hypothetical protein
MITAAKPYLVVRSLVLITATWAFGPITLAAQTPFLSDPPAADVQLTRIKPSEADPAVKTFDNPNVVVVDPHTAPSAPLALFLPGTGGRPMNSQGLLRVIAGQGYRAIGLMYDDEPAVVQVCPKNDDPACSADFRRERIFGNVDSPPVSNPVEESIVHRLVMLLRYLDRQQPDAHWGDYLAGDEPVWSRIVVSGLSQGAGMAAYIAKKKEVARVVLFSSPWDFYGRGKTLAPWMSDSSSTPPERWFAEYHQRENTADLIAQAYRKLKIPANHVAVFNLDVPDGGKGPNPFHPSTVHLPGYEPQWKWLYGQASGSQASSGETSNNEAGSAKP